MMSDISETESIIDCQEFRREIRESPSKRVNLRSTELLILAAVLTSLDLELDWIADDHHKSGRVHLPHHRLTTYS
jgi:hypothetical protein